MADEHLEVADWRRRVAAMWVAWREASAADPEGATQRFRADRDRLFAEHPQSPLLPGERASFGGFGSLAPIALPNSGAETIAFRKIGRVTLDGPPAGQALPVFWIEGYGGGIFLPFRDGTSGAETYGAGRYLLDTIKSADHGGDAEAGTLLLDFNLAYHPSCAYDPEWSCPLAPLESILQLPVQVGERLRGEAHG